MKKYICLVVIFAAINGTYAQNITISFQPKVSSILIDSVLATNLRTDESVKLFSGESLILVNTPVSIKPIPNDSRNGTIYPNPTNEDAVFSFSTDKNELVQLRLFNSSGQLLNQNKQYLESGNHNFEVKFPVAGIYYLSMLNGDVNSSFKAIYTGKNIQASSVSYSGIENFNLINTHQNQLKGATEEKMLNYAEDDIIQYSVFSGVNITIISDTAALSKTIDVEFVRCVDADNKSYKVVQIGTQWWMAENLAYLPTINIPPDVSSVEPNYYVYGYGEYNPNVIDAKAFENYTKHGVLYNWLAAKTSCPVGWHVPSENEWEQLEISLGMTYDQILIPPFNYRGTDQGSRMKSTTWLGWYNGTNSTGFNALPSGDYAGGFRRLGSASSFWSSTEYSSGYHYIRELVSSWEGIAKGWGSRMNGISVRCTKDDEIVEIAPVSEFSALGTSITKGQDVKFIDKSTNNPSNWWWSFGDGNYSSDQNPSHTYEKVGKYSISLQTTNDYGTNKKSVQRYITVTDPGISGQTGNFEYDGRTYKTIIINGKEWMAENLAYLPKVNLPTEASDTEPCYYVYDYTGNDTTEAQASDNYINYGVLYNWPAAMAACPPGWHLPSDEEWMHLEMALGLSQNDAFLFGNRTNDYSDMVGRMIEENGGWDLYYRGENNSGFSALPSGEFHKNYGEKFTYIGKRCAWWSSTEVVSNWAISRNIGPGGHNGLVGRNETEKNLGYSVRCVKD